MMEVIQLIQVELPEKSSREDSLTPYWFVKLIQFYKQVLRNQSECIVQFPVPRPLKFGDVKRT